MSTMEINFMILMVGVLVVALILAGPTLYQDYKKRKRKQ